MVSIINRFHNVAPNNLKPSQCTPTTRWELSEDTKSATWSTMVWEISAWQKKHTHTHAHAHTRTHTHKIKQEVCHTVTLPSAFKSNLKKAKTRIMKTSIIFHHAKIIKFQNNPLQKNQNPSRYYYNSIITNLKFQHKPKYHF
jgi:hypothetical protein